MKHCSKIYLVCFLMAACHIATFGQKHEVDTALINELNAASFSLLKEDPDSAAALAKKAIALSGPSHYLKGLGDGYIRLGILEKDNGNYEEAITHYRKSLVFRMQIGDKDLISRVYNNMGMAYSLSAHYDSAIHYLTMAMKIAEELELSGAQAMYAMNIGIAYEKNRDFNEALKYNAIGRKLYIEEEDSTGIMKSWINEASIHLSLYAFDKSIALYRKALPYALALEDEFNENIIIGDLAVTYMELQMNDSALHYLRQTASYHLENENMRNATIALSNMGMLFGKLNLTDSAIIYLKRSLAIAEEIGAVDMAAKSAEELSDIYVTNGNFKLAYEYQLRYIQFNDSVFNQNKAAAIAEMQTRYETDKKESQIALLNKDKKLKQHELDQRKLLQRSLIVGMVLLVMVGVLYFSRFRLKKQLEQQQALLSERKRISSELHDDLGAQLSTARMFLSNLKEQKGNKEKEIIESSIGLIDNSISDLRKIMDELQSSTLQQKGIIGATEELVNRIGRIQPIRFTLSHHGLAVRPDGKTEHQLFRITQELINNTLKYASASHVTIEYLVRDGNILLLYEDDGKGFDHTVVKKGYGLSNIASRAESVGGSAEFDSAPGMGSRVIIEMPYHEHTAKA